MGKNIKMAYIEATKAWEKPDQLKGDEKVQGLNRLIEGIKSIFDSDDVKDALSLLSKNAQKSVVEAATAAEVASSQLGKSLKNSPQWKSAILELNNSLALLLSILALSGSRLLKEVTADLNKQLPQSE